MKIITESTNTSGLSVLLEKYMGRSQNLVKAEGLFRKVISRIKKEKGAYSGIGHGGTVALSNSPEMTEIKKLFGKEFNIKNVMIEWVAEQQPNAFTLPKIINTTDPRKDKDKQTQQVYIVLHTGLITVANLEADELMAIILHEFGHNFYRSYLHTLAMFSVNIDTIFTNDSGRLPLGPIQGILQQFGISSYIHKIQLTVVEMIKTSFKPVAALTKAVQNIMLGIESMVPKSWVLIPMAAMLPYNAAQWLFTYTIEKESDSFAVDYGYASSLASALDKISSLRPSDKDASGRMRKIPLLGAMYDLDYVIFTMGLGILGSYPSHNKRVYESMKRLEKYSNDKSIPPEVRKKIKNDLDLVNTYIEQRSKTDETDRMKYTQMYMEALNNVDIARMDIRDMLDFANVGYKL